MATGLFAKIGVLAAGNFVLIEARGAGFRAGVEGRVVGADGFPVIGALVERFDVELRVARSVAQGVDDGIEIGLAGAAAHGGDGGVGDVYAGVGGFENGGGVEAAGVVGVEMDGDADFFAEGFDEFVGGVGFAEAGHVFDGEEVRAELFELLGHLDVILQRIFRARVDRGCRRCSRWRLRRCAAGFERRRRSRRSCCRWS